MQAYLNFGDEQRITEVKIVELWWQKRGLTYTASGYGRKIPTRYMVKHNSRWRRVYACQLGNAASLYLGKPGAWECVVDIW